MSIAILVPSRGRPERAADMARLALANGSPAVEVLVICDADDPTLPRYREEFSPQHTRARLVVLKERLGFVGSLNTVAMGVWNDVDVLGAFGDDVAFRTPGWDRRVEATLETPGIAYGDDLVHGANHPTAVFMSSAIATALGWLAMPGVRHQWADDAWKRLGQELGCLRFMADVIVEHMHPAVGKAAMDATYESIFGGNEAAANQAGADHAAFQEWERRYLAGDVAAVRRALAVPS